MTTPNPTDVPKPSRLRPRQVVTFRHPDPVTGTDVEEVGVVITTGGEGEAVTIRPLASFVFSVDPEYVSPASADDVG